MKKSILYFFIVGIFFSSCGTVKNDEIYGSWLAVHIFFEGEELLDNDFKETGWFPKYHKTKSFYINKGYNNINLYLGWHDDPPILADFRTLKKNDSLYFEIYNSTDERFNGLYKRTIETDTVWDEDIKVAYYFLTLESEDTKIMAVRNKALNWGNGM